MADDAHAQTHTGVEQDGPQTRVAALQCTDDRITLADRAKPAPIDIETQDPFDSSRARPAISLGSLAAARRPSCGLMQRNLTDTPIVVNCPRKLQFVLLAAGDGAGGPFSEARRRGERELAAGSQNEAHRTQPWMVIA